MVIGNGLIATAFREYQNSEYIIFASGVSNSLETDESKFKKEENLLRKTLEKNKHIVYFSSVNYLNQYGTHKKYMEYLVQGSDSYTIIKLPQVIGTGGNPANLFNYLVRNIGKEITVYDKAYKSLIDVEDLKAITKLLLKISSNKGTFELPYIEKLTVLEIVNLIGKVMNINPKIKLVDHESTLPIRSTFMDCILNYLSIEPEGYTERIIKKYLCKK
jgi:nucleoside-diphosphate-sugar epimerase